MANAVVWENGRQVVRKATVSDVPEGHPIALEMQRETMVVSRFQARAALTAAGLLAQAETAVANAGPEAQLAWAEAVEFKRLSPTILALAPLLNLDDAALDALFITAGGIEA